MITSTANPRIRELVKLKKSARERMKEGVFLVEGPKMFREIPQNLCREVYGSESFLRTEEGSALLRGKGLWKGSGKGPEKGSGKDSEKGSGKGSEKGSGKDYEKGSENGFVEMVSDPVFQYLSDTKTPQGILAVVKQQEYELPDLIKKETAPLILILENLQDPGNLGTILRTAEAAGAAGIILSSGCADIYSPKVTRSTMGSIFRVPFLYTDSLKETILSLKRQGVRILAAHLKGSVSLYEASLTGAAALMIGNESRGLTEEIAALSDCAVRIPMSGSVESLNAAVAASILMFEARRQRMAQAYV